MKLVLGNGEMVEWEPEPRKVCVNTLYAALEAFKREHPSYRQLSPREARLALENRERTLSLPFKLESCGMIRGGKVYPSR